MSRVSKVVRRLVGGAMPVIGGQRAVSTSSRAENSLSLQLDFNVKHCPFRATVENLGRGQAVPLDTVPEEGAETTVKPFEAVPGPKGLPVIGTLLDYFKKDGPRFSKMFEVYRARSLQFGPVYKEQIGPVQMVVVSDPAEYSKVMRAEGKFPIRREMEPMAYYRQQKGLSLGLVNSQGEEWHRQRAATAKHMLKLQAVAQFLPPMEAVAEEFSTQLQHDRQADGELDQLQSRLLKWAMESIGTFLFEERIGCLDPQPSQLAQDFIHHICGFFRLMQPLMYNLPLYKLLPTPSWRQYQFHSDQLMNIGRQFVDKKITALKRGENKNTSSFLNALLANQSLSATDVTGTAVDILTASVETTSTALTWCLYCLAKNPDAQQHILSEQRSVLTDGGSISHDHLAQMPYLKAVLKETLRVYPITYATSRILPSDIEIAGYQIPAGSHVQANLYGMFHDEKLFPEPERFKPERWLKESHMDPKLKSLSNLVWGHGARMCIGRRLAEQQIHLIMAKIISKFQLSYHHGDIEPILTTLMTPDKPLRIKFTPRCP